MGIFDDVVEVEVLVLVLEDVLVAAVISVEGVFAG